MGRGRLRSIMVGALALALVATQVPARAFAPIAALAPHTVAAVTGYDAVPCSGGEWSTVLAAPGDTKQFSPCFQNTGTNAWVVGSGSASQVNLAICNDGSCNLLSPHSDWASGWLSTTAYATSSPSFVGPGQTANFPWQVVVPAGTPP